MDKKTWLLIGGIILVIALMFAGIGVIQESY